MAQLALVRAEPVAEPEGTEQPESRGRRALPWAVLGIAVAGGLLLRLWQINALGFNSDEAVYAGQAASIARVPELSQIFPIFRAHPLLFQFSLSVLYQGGASDLAARLLAVAFAIATIPLVFSVASTMYGRSVGAVTALLMMAMPYHVIVSRQALLDVPEVFFATLTLFTVVKLATTGRVAWLYATGGALGLTFLSKETGIVLLPAIYAFLALTPEIRIRLRQVLLSLAVFALVILPFPLSIKLGGGSSTSQSFLVWQLFRPANHLWSFYLTEVPRALGYLVVIAAVAGLWFLRGGPDRWRQRLLLTWILVPYAFFQLWPVKGFQYLLAIAPAVAILAARGLALVPLGQGLNVQGRHVRERTLRAALVVVVIASLVIPSWTAITAANSSTFLAGSGGVPGGREAGAWLHDHSPERSQVLAIGPSMANILEFYGRRRTFRLSVSPNPLHRNPAYDPIVNPDLALRSGEIQYIAWDSFSADRSDFFATKLMGYVRRYHGHVVHTETVSTLTEDGRVVDEPVIVIYEVRP